MAHYDCGHCGYRMGIDYGSCERCTPNWVKEAERTYTAMRYEIEAKVKKEFEKETKALQKRIDERETMLLAGYKEDRDLTYAAGKQWYKRKGAA